jgi:hypothetical protein
VTAELEVLDPRYDAEPAYWRELRERAGLRADWSWEVLTTQAWCTRTPLLIAVLRDAGQVTGVVSADWAGVPVRRNGFVPIGRGPLLGGLHVRAPGTGSVPGWWSAGELPTAELLHRYLHGMRRAIGLGCRGAVVRQLTADDAARLAGRPRLVRPTEQLARLPMAGWRTREDWIAALTRNRRKNLRKIFRRIDADPAIEVTVEPGSNIDPVAVAAVLRHNEGKYRGWLLAPLPQSTGYLAALLRQPDVFVGCYRDSHSGRLLAVVTILDHPQWPVARHWSSVPVDRPDRPNLYLHNYGLLVSWALRNDKQGLLIGRGKPELKLTLGAELVPQFAAALPVW